jgi:phosphoglycerate dehydrogenase-like enzyme
MVLKMNELKLLVSFPLPSSYIEKIKDVYAPIKVWQGNDEKELLDLIKDADILFAGVFSLKMFLAAKKLKWIQTSSAGVENFLFPEVVESKVIITNAAGVNSIPVSEHVIAMMLCLSRKLHCFIRNQMERKWEFLGPLDELSGKTVGIVGLGRIGGEIAKKAKSLGMRVIATRRNPLAPTPTYIDKFVHPENLKELLAESDFVVLALPLTKDTNGIIGEAQLRSMKSNSYLINASRGKLVKEEKLIQALEEGWIEGAGLDVVEIEPLPEDSPLWKMENVIITPHVAGFTPYYLERLADIFCENLKRFVSGENLINAVDKTLGY